jgi:hypothetical protein
MRRRVGEPCNLSVRHKMYLADPLVIRPITAYDVPEPAE